MRDFIKHAPEVSATHTALRWHLLAQKTKSAMMRKLAQHQCDGWKQIAQNERALQPRDHCTECDCILTAHESEHLCRSCEERTKHE